MALADSADVAAELHARQIRTPPDLDVLHVGDDLVLTTPLSTLRLTGGVARVVEERLLPLFAAGAPWSLLRTACADLPCDEVERLVDRLLETGLLREVTADPSPSWTRLVTTSPDEEAALASRAASARVIVVGTADVGPALVGLLATAGIGTVVVADPTGEPERHDVADVFGAPARRVERIEVQFVREAVPEMIGGADLVVTVLDPVLSAMRVWVNEAGLVADVPSLHAVLRGTRAEVGPLVLPGDGPCYLCWRMRALACADDFTVGMAHEEVLHAARRTRRPGAPTWPMLVPWVAAILGREALAVVTGAVAPGLHGRVLTVDGLDLAPTAHRVIARPDCSACAKKSRRAQAATPGLGDLVAAPVASANPASVINAAVSEVCGVVRALDHVTKVPEEPELPVIARAQLANFRFLSGPQGFLDCTGKATTAADAEIGAVAEALEHYAAMTWLPARTATGARKDLDGPTLDPRALVLFAEEQYRSLPFATYEDATVLDWVAARSLASDGDVWVPLLAAHLAYMPSDPRGRLFAPTSNGFAAGATLTQAVLRALLEVVERDAYLIGWAHRLAGVRSDARTVPDGPTRDIAYAYSRRGVRIDVHQLPVDTSATVVLAAAWADAPPAVCVGLGADLDPVLAARRAVLEVGQVRPGLRARLRDPATVDRLAELVEDPARVVDLEDHALLYTDPRAAEAGLGYLLDEPVRPWTVPAVKTSSDGESLRRLVSSLLKVTDDVLYLDVTPDDVARLGVRVARGIVPGFQPIHFGAGHARLGGERLFRMPGWLGVRPSSTLRDELNLAPHPVA